MANRATLPAMSKHETLPLAPVAERRPHVDSRHGHDVEDPYHWIRQRDDPEVLKLLEAENAYTEAVLAPQQSLREALYNEMLARIQETDQTVPVQKGAYLYYVRTEKGRQYPIFCRRHRTMDAPEEILIDVNVLADGHGYFKLGAIEVSPDHKLLAYSTDTDGSETFTIRVKDLARGTLLDDRVGNASYGLEWANDNATLYYTVLDKVHRPYRLYRHRLGSDPSNDERILEEPDERFFLELYKTKSERYLVVQLDSNITSEAHLIDADDPTAQPRRVAERVQGVEYGVDHQEDRLLLLTNADGATNFKLLQLPLDDFDPAGWTTLLEHDPEVKLGSIDVFRDHLVINQRKAGLTGLRILDRTGNATEVDFDEPVYAVHSTHETEYASGTLRFVYSSLTTPDSTFDYDLSSGERLLRKRQPVPGGYEPSDYTTERTWATSHDGTRVPISLVYRNDRRRAAGNPTLLYGYGSYGISVDPHFDAKRISLLDRGFVFAIGHIRGGGDLGRPWYEDGKLERKQNTFSDFIACAEHLLAETIAAPGRLAIRGGSAGGLLVGAVLNQRPALFAAAIAKVPFVDVINTMSDPTLPLTAVEWEEWGDPRQPEPFATMRAYSPYENVAAQDYPTLLVFSGLNDPRVAYWEPTKWVARLRRRGTGDRPILLKTDLGAGHGGPSGRYDFLEETALEYAFLVDAVGG